MRTPRAEVVRLCWKAVAVALAGWLILALPSEGAADSSLSPLTVVKQQDKLAVSTQIGGGLFSIVEETIISGIPATFSYEIEIWLKRRLWADKSIIAKAVERVVRFNSLTNEYQVAQRDKTASWERTTKDLEEAKSWISRVDTLPIVKLSDLDPDKTYYIRARATVKTERSSSVSKFIFFFHPRSKKTAWEQSEPFLVKELRASTAPTPALAPSGANP